MIAFYIFISFCIVFFHCWFCMAQDFSLYSNLSLSIKVISCYTYGNNSINFWGRINFMLGNLEYCILRQNYLLLTKQISYHHAIKSCELNKKKILIMNKVMHRVFPKFWKTSVDSWVNLCWWQLLPSCKNFIVMVLLCLTYTCNKLMKIK